MEDEHDKEGVEVRDNGQGEADDHAVKDDLRGSALLQPSRVTLLRTRGS